VAWSGLLILDMKWLNDELWPDGLIYVSTLFARVELNERGNLTSHLQRFGVIWALFLLLSVVVVVVVVVWWWHTIFLYIAL